MRSTPQVSLFIRVPDSFPKGFSSSRTAQQSHLIPCAVCVPGAGCQKQEIIPNSWSSSPQSPEHTAGGGGSKWEAACKSWLGLFSSFMEKGGKVTFQPQKKASLGAFQSRNKQFCVLGFKRCQCPLGLFGEQAQCCCPGVWFAWSKEPTMAKGQNQSGVGPEGKIPVILGRCNSCDSRTRQNLSVTCCLCQPLNLKL